VLHKIHLPAYLEIHPEFCGYVEKFSQSKCGARSDTAATIDDVVDSLMGDMDCVARLR